MNFPQKIDVMKVTVAKTNGGTMFLCLSSMPLCFPMEALESC